MKKHLNVFWFRRDLRLFDNHGLFRALSEDLPVLCLFIFDPDILKQFPNSDDRRVTFIFETLQNMNHELKPYKGKIEIAYGNPVEIFMNLTESFVIQNVYCNHDYEPFAIQRDIRVNTFLDSKGISFLSFKDQVHFEKKEITTDSEKPYTVFTPYMKKWKQQFSNNPFTYYPSEKLIDKILPGKSQIAKIEDIGYSRTSFKFPAAKLDEEIIKNYHLTRDYPSLHGTSKLGIHLRFGTISVRQTAKIASKLNETWLNELIWREFFMQLLWNYPHVEKEAYKKKYNFIPWSNNESDFSRWCRGETGFPIVDAGIRELIETGHMHNRVRMITANFLTKLLLIDWKWGEQFFAEHLLDYELSSNNGNWQWAAGTGADAAPYFRIFNPEEQTKRYDPNLSYIKQFINPDTPTYPKPMINYKENRQRCLHVFKTTFS